MASSSDVQPDVLRLLVADRRGWIARTLATVLDAGDWRVSHVRTGAEARARLARERPHVVLINDDLMDEDVPALCAALRADPAIGVLTPIIALSTQPLRERRLAALRGGATATTLFPPDSEPFLLELRALALARREAERLERAALVDAGTGLYTLAGLAHRATEIANEANRRHDPVTCVALTVDRPPPAGAEPPAGETEVPVARAAAIDDAIARARRRSDAVGRDGEMFVAIGPATGGVGAHRMAERLRAALVEAAHVDVPAQPVATIRAGYCTVADLARSSLDLGAMIERARSLLAAEGEATPDASPIVGEEVPLSD